MILDKNRLDTFFGEADENKAPIKGGVVARMGGLALLDADGFYNPAEQFHCAGAVIEPPDLTGYDNSTGDDGDKSIRFRRNDRIRMDVTADTANAPMAADIDAPLFAEDDHTVTLEPWSADGFRAYVGEFLRLVGDECELELDPDFSPAHLRGREVAPLQTVHAADALIFNPFQKKYPVKGDGGAVTLTAAFPDGLPGQEITLIGTDNTNTVTVTTAINTLTAAGASAPLAKGGAITFMWDETADAWIEKSRSLNA